MWVCVIAYQKTKRCTFRLSVQLRLHFFNHDYNFCLTLRMPIEKGIVRWSCPERNLTHSDHREPYHCHQHTWWRRFHCRCLHRELAEQRRDQSPGVYDKGGKAEKEDKRKLRQTEQQHKLYQHSQANSDFSTNTCRLSGTKQMHP